ncbi:YegS/Rv2252/BmrU family lipid kinase [Spiractinospora alimapuensis]|uniref:diacylglycerol/lipid kinase family protein n=1 Tax=Spiractinospora alimapuensis TaxID=2820884 RepID=UPI001F48676F|nr:YegS/Rv2252/BmrU family lipid kinase [Spiractinospora alimapuensis]QVQ52042.1 YegS/Rv2252/BmrU family lipid kinase [Spiractinospora alimapuensis]
MRRITAVVNPAAGGLRRRRDVDLVREVLKRLQAEGDVVTLEYTRDLDHAGTLAATAARRDDMVIAVGGDGTVGAVAAGVSAADGVLGVIPSGRGNDFARQLELPRDAGALGTILSKGKSRAVDLVDTPRGTVAGNVCTGVDALAAVYVDGFRFLGGAGYHAAALRAVAAWRPVSYTVTVDGARRRFRGYTVLVANSGFYGNGRHAAPQARVDDGLLDVMLLHEVPLPVFLSVAMRELYDGTHVRRPEVEVLRGREVEVRADRALPCCGDGEVLGVLPLSMRVRAGALRVVTA